MGKGFVQKKKMKDFPIRRRQCQVIVMQKLES